MECQLTAGAPVFSGSVAQGSGGEQTGDNGKKKGRKSAKRPHVFSRLSPAPIAARRGSRRLHSVASTIDPGGAGQAPGSPRLLGFTALLAPSPFFGSSVGKKYLKKGSPLLPVQPRIHSARSLESLGLGSGKRRCKQSAPSKARGHLLQTWDCSRKVRSAQRPPLRTVQYFPPGQLLEQGVHHTTALAPGICWVPFFHFLANYGVVKLTFV